MKNLFFHRIIVIILASITPTVLYSMMTKSQTECTATAKKFEYNCNVLFLHKKKAMSDILELLEQQCPLWLWPTT